MILFQDEARFGLISTLKTMWAKRGKPLNMPIQLKHEWFYIYSAVCPQTGEKFTCFLPRVDTEVMNIYLHELSNTYPDMEMLLILDRAPWHRSKKLDVPDNIRLELLPPYSPKLNPVERLWKWLRQEATHNRIFESLDEMENRIEEEYLKIDLEMIKSLCNCNYL